MARAADGNSGLTEWRMLAAHASGGVSEDSIYTMVESVLAGSRCRGKILDYGAGVGAFSRRLLRMGQFDQVYAADIMPPPPERDGIVWITQDLNSPILGYDGYFDVIVAVEVIEHIENPREMVRELFRMCKAGGHVIVTTPNNESVRALISLLIRGHYVAFTDASYPAHISALLRKDLSRIFLEAGFADPVFGYTNAGAIPGLTRLSWQTLSFGLLGSTRFSDGVLAMARKPE